MIVNNQIGFTTLPRQGRFTPYPTDVAKMIQAPIFHVNGDDPEACVHAARLAIAFRQEFHCDVMIDVWCYRKNGHNEQDEPSFTQPVMAREIAAKTSVRDLYAKQLIDEGVITAESPRGDENRSQRPARRSARRKPAKPSPPPFRCRRLSAACGRDFHAPDRIGPPSPRFRPMFSAKSAKAPRAFPTDLPFIPSSRR